ncbi:MAG: cadherin domain-containing protein [Bacteroidales bacterium]|nr:cadherin domain-containing protein [Bacteroidales bacterium]
MGNGFSINTNTGVLTINNPAAVCFEGNPIFLLNVQVTDELNLTEQALVTVNVQDINEAPVCQGQSFTINENSAVATSVGTVVATDPDFNQNLSFSIGAGNTANAFAIDGSTGLITVNNSAVLDFETTPVFTLTINVVDDGLGTLSTSSQVTISLADVNESPLANDQTFSVQEFSALGTSVGMITATDPDAGQSLTYNLLSSIPGEAFSLNTTTGELTVSDPALLDSYTHPVFELQIEVLDNGSGLLSDQATILVYVQQGPNLAPVIANQSFSIAENSLTGTIIGNVVASDPNTGQQISYTILSGNTSGAFSINPATGQLTVLNSAVLNFEATSTFSLLIEVEDNGSVSLSSQATITISLTDVNESPNISNQSFSIAENSMNGTSVGLVAASDPDAGQTLAYSILSGNTSGAFAVNTTTGAITVANSAAMNYEVNPVFNLSIQVQDNGIGSLSSQAEITINLVNANEAPVISNQSFSIAENSANGTMVGTVTATDPDAGQTLTYSIQSGNSSSAFALNTTTGVLTVSNSAALDFETTPVYSLIVRVQDNGTGTLSSNATVTVTLQNVNDQPQVNDQVFAVAENAANGTNVGIVTATDPDAGQQLSYSILSGNTDGAFTINTTTGALTVANTSALDFEINPAFILSVNVQDNGTGTLSDQADITINIVNGNEPPVIQPQAFSTLEHQVVGTIVSTVTASDPDPGQSVTFAITSGNFGNGFSINTNTGVLTINNPAAVCFEGHPLFLLNVQVTDELNLTEQALVTVNVQDINEAPVCQGQSFTINENSAVATSVGTVVATDPDFNQNLSFSIGAGNTANAFAIDGSTGLITVNNSAVLDFETTPVFTLTINVVDDGLGTLSTSSQITISLADVNESPLANDQTFSVQEFSALGTTVGMIAATDPDAGQSLTYNLLSSIPGEAFTLNTTTGELTVSDPALLDSYTHPVFELQIEVLDNGSGLLSDQATILVYVQQGPNLAPVIANQSFSIAENSLTGTIIGNVVASDPNTGQQISYSILSGNTSGAFTLNPATGQLTVLNSAVLNFEATSSFSLLIEVEDNGSVSLSSQATITISLTDVNESPNISNQTFSIAENSMNGTSVGLVAASDPDAGQTLAYSILSGNTSGAFAVNTTTGAITVANSAAMNYEVNPVFNLSIQVQDNGIGGLSSQAVITINLVNANEAPVISNQSFSIAENSTNGTTVGTVTAVDPDAGQTLTYSIQSGNIGGSFAINSLTGALIIANSAALNFETIPIYSLVIKVQDNGLGLLSSQATVSISLIDLNEIPVITNQELSVQQNAPVGTSIGTILAMDPDAGQFLTYTITAGNTDNAFSLDALTGELTVLNSAALDFIVNPQIVLTVMVVDNGTGALSNSATIVVYVLEELNNPPIISEQEFLVDENSPFGTFVGTVIASDLDPGQELTYSITSGNLAGAFTIDPNTGVLSVSNSAMMDYEAYPFYELQIQVMDNGFGSLFNHAMVTISLRDLNEVPNLPLQTFATTENSVNGSIVGQIEATDPDFGQNLTFTILSGNDGNAFDVGQATGIITISNSSAINFETDSLIQLEVKVEDDGDGNLFAIVIDSIFITNINEIPEISEQVFTISESANIGTVLGSVIASDPDQGQSVTYSILSGNPNGTFAVDSNSGLLTLANNSALDFEVLPVYQLSIQVMDNSPENLTSTAIITINLLDQNEAPVLEDETFIIVENTPGGILIGTLIANDPDQNQVLTYTILSGNTENAFAIDAFSGELTISNENAINFEVNPAFNLIIQVQDNGTGLLADNAAITIAINDLNENPVADDQVFSILEFSANGTEVGTILASDPDNGQSLVFAITSGNSNNAFQVNPATGLISVANSIALNYQNNPVYTLLVNVTDNGSPVMMESTLITIHVLPEQNQSPVISSQQFDLPENASNATIVGNVIATDPNFGQILTYGILSGNTSSAFIINPLTGEISVANSMALDFEVTPAFNLIIEVTDNGLVPLSSTAVITIDLLNVNETPSVSNQQFTINENSINGFIVGNILASDPDSGDALTYNIINGNTNGAFDLDQITGVLTVANMNTLNFEVYPMFTLAVQVNDIAGLNAQATVVVHLSDINEMPSVENQAFTIAENTSNGTSIGTVIASDPDEGQLLEYSIIDGNTNTAFSIDIATGMLSVANSAALDYESGSSFNLIVQVQDNGSGSLYSQALVTVFITDVNENPVVNDQQFSILEFSVNGTQIGVVEATDPDNGQALAYSIISGNVDNAFAIDPSNGMISVANTVALDYLINPIFSLVVRVMDNGTTSLFSDASIIINLIPDPNQPPVVLNQLFIAEENAIQGTYIGTVVASDPNAGQVLTYSLVSGNTNEAFSLDSETGVILVNNPLALNFEILSSFSLLVRVTDDGTGNLSSQALINVEVLDVNEAPVISAQTFTVNENAANETKVGIVEATDPDPGQILQYAIISGNTDNAFMIDPLSGEISVANSSALNFDLTPSYLLLVKVVDNGVSNLSSEAVITVNVLDNNNPPAILDKYFRIAENAPNGSIVGKVRVVDPDSGQIMHYLIVSGNTNNAFSIDVNTGILRVSNSAALNYETDPAFDLIIRVMDNGQPMMSTQSIVTVELTDVNELPFLANYQFDLPEGSAVGTIVGTISGIEQDSAQWLTYKVVSGNYDSTFSVNALTGEISVINTALLDFTIKPLFTLGISATDNSSELLATTAFVKIRIIEQASSRIVYIDPDHTGDLQENGSFEHPFDSWNDVVIEDGHTYLQKRGSRSELSKGIVIFNRANVTLDAYGTGANPELFLNIPQSSIISVENSNNTIIRNLSFTSDGSANNCIYVSGYQASILNIDSCWMHSANYGLLSIAQNLDIEINACTIEGMYNDGIQANDFDKFEMGYTEISNTNLNWITNPDTEGDGIDLYSPDGKVYLHHNLIDNSMVGNSSCVRVGGSSFTMNAEFNRLKASIGASSSNMVINNTTGEVISRYNAFTGGDIAINTFSESHEIYYNQFLNNGTGILIQKNKSAEVTNNTFVQSKECFIESMDGTDVKLTNNIFSPEMNTLSVYKIGGSITSNYNLFSTEFIGFLNGFATLSSWSASSGQDLNSKVADPLFTNPETLDFSLQNSSPAINAGTLTPITEDYFGKMVPMFNYTDIGFYESEAQLLDSEKDSTGINNTLIVKVYPNPANDFVKINFEHNVDILSLRLMDERGIDMLRREMKDTREASLDVHHLSAGVYFLIITADEQLISRKVIIRK